LSGRNGGRFTTRWGQATTITLANLAYNFHRLIFLERRRAIG